MSWQDVTDKAFAELAKLGPNWDSYGGLPIDPAKIVAAKYVLSLVMSDSIRIPKVVPMSNGSVQLEWSGRDIEIELEIVAREGLLYCTVLSEETMLAQDSVELDQVRKALVRLG